MGGAHHRRTRRKNPRAGATLPRKPHYDHGGLGYPAPAPRRTSTLDDRHPLRHPRTNRPARWRFRLLLPLLQRRRAHSPFRHPAQHRQHPRPGRQRHRLARKRREQTRHPGCTHRRRPAQPRRRIRLQRPNPQLPAHPHDLVVRWQPLPPPPRPEPPARRLAKTRNHHRQRTLLDRDRQTRRHRPARDHQLRTQRPHHDRRLLQHAHRADEKTRRTTGRSQKRLRHLPRPRQTLRRGRRLQRRQNRNAMAEKLLRRSTTKRAPTAHRHAALPTILGRKQSVRKPA